MPTSEIYRMIQAEKNLIFEAMSNIENLSGGVPELKNIAFLSDQKSRNKNQVQEKQKDQRSKSVIELEVIDYLENEHFRILSNYGRSIRDC